MKGYLFDWGYTFPFRLDFGPQRLRCAGGNSKGQKNRYEEDRYAGGFRLHDESESLAFSFPRKIKE
jgi:hypothetical protein